VGRRKVKRGLGKTALQGKDFRLAEEIDYIQSRAAEHDGRLVTVGPLVLFSTETGDAWLLDPADHLAAHVARDGVRKNSTSKKPTAVSLSELIPSFFMLRKVDGGSPKHSQHRPSLLSIR
jgi:hypothetical protein